MKSKRLTSLSTAKNKDVVNILNSLISILPDYFNGWSAAHYLVDNSDLATINTGLNWFKEKNLTDLLKLNTKQYKNGCEKGSTILDIALFSQNYKNKVPLVLPFCHIPSNSLSKNNFHYQAFSRRRNPWEYYQINVTNTIVPSEIKNMFKINPYLLIILNNQSDILPLIFNKLDELTLNKISNDLLNDYQDNIFNIYKVSNKFYFNDIYKYAQKASEENKVNFFNFVYYDNPVICYNLSSGISFVHEVISHDIFSFINDIELKNFKKLKIDDFKNLCSKIEPNKSVVFKDLYHYFISRLDIIKEEKLIGTTLNNLNNMDKNQKKHKL